MQYILVLGVASMLVIGQSLWKFGIMHAQTDGDMLKKLLALAFNPAILLGCVVYLVATVLYMYTIGRYAYGVSYAMIVSFSLIFATIAANVVFREKISILNIVGIFVILLGVSLVLAKR